MPRLVIAYLVVLTSSSISLAQPRQRAGREHPPRLPGATVEVYKTIGDVKLNMYIFAPGDHKPADKRPAIVFFFGGGWRSGSPAQLTQHCQYLASRGMVAMTADYRVLSRHGTKAVKCVEDAKSAVRWIRKNAQRLGVDPELVAAGGGSAGGHIAACTGVVPGFDAEDEDTSISSVPNAMVLFNPALVLANVDGQPPLGKERATLPERIGVEPRELSPYHHVRKDLPPTIIFHGTADPTVPFRTAKIFAETMQAAGNRCELAAYEGEVHGFFNYGRGGNVAYVKTVRRMDEFLAELEFIEGKPTIE